MRKYNLYLAGFAALFSGGILAMEPVDLAGHYRGVAVQYGERARAATAAEGTATFFLQEADKATSRAGFYEKAQLDGMVGALDFLLKSTITAPVGHMQPHIGYYPSHMGYDPYGGEVPLFHFFSCVKDRSAIGIREEHNIRLLLNCGVIQSAVGEQLRGVLMGFLSYVATRIPGVPIVTSDVADLELFLNGAVLPFLCRTATTACEYYRSAQIDEEVQRRKALDPAADVATVTQAAIAVGLAQKEQGVLKVLVAKLEEVVDALRRAGRMS